MAKGDKITVVVAGSAGPDPDHEWTLMASKAGRKVVQQTRPRTKSVWLDVIEQTRTGRDTGNRMTFRLDAVLAIMVTTLDVPDEPRPKMRAVRITAADVAKTGRDFEALGRPEPLGLGEP